MRLHPLIALCTLVVMPATALGQAHAPAAHASAAPAVAPAVPAAPVSRAPARPEPAAPVAAPANSHADAIMAEVQALPPNDEQALQSLMDGNYRFVDGVSTHPRVDADRITQTATEGQKPFATILTCSDSRVPPEIVFDQGIGDLFIVRVAGNVISPDEAGSIEYGTGHLHTPLLVVLGHTSCGAVTAAAQHAQVEGNVQQLLERIQPAVVAAQRQDANLAGAALVSAAIRENVWNSVEVLLTSSEEIRHLVSEDKLRVVGAIYDIRTGNVRWLGRHPRQAQLLAGGHQELTSESELITGSEPMTVPTTPVRVAPAAAPAHAPVAAPVHSAPAATPSRKAAPANTNGGHSKVDEPLPDAADSSHSAVDHALPAQTTHTANTHAPANSHASVDAHASTGHGAAASPADHSPAHSQVSEGEHPAADEHATADGHGAAAHTADEILAEAGPEAVERLRQKFTAEAEYNNRNSRNVIYVSIFLGIAGLCSAFLIHRMERHN